MKRLLLIDDEPLIRLSIRNLEDWQAHGMEFTYEATNGREALEIIAKHRDIDAIIVDVDMPLMDGLDMVETLQAQGNKLPILFLSSFDTFNFVRRAFKSGAVDYILKSEMDEGRLLANLDRIFSIKGGHKKNEKAEDQISQQEKQDILRNIIATADTNTRSFSLLNKLGLKPPFILFVIRPIDIQNVKDRYKDDIESFKRIVVDIIRQSLAKITYGEVFSLSFERYLVLSPAMEIKDQFISDFSRSAYQYLDMEFEIQQSDPIDSWCSLRDAYNKVEDRMTSFSRLVVRTRKYVRQNYKKPSIHLFDIAQFVGVSKNYLSWEYTRETGESVSFYISKVRIEAAKQLLTTTNLKIYEIAEHVGFENVETFCRVFKRITGTNPRKYSQ